eukprot:CAMPEP_0118928098 /NCGR_PEP_ID=MMETSP1169-20130426/5433_1 /TAXON_ID=36882 /ORGANISM="Pyramimonas obovata, Strain CCMP722" /LENGTH=137 /DNA_ID=CAMNT_0006870001 /DNA_START=74 /DNA_END=487 /DNA_ORIENTATION=-
MASVVVRGGAANCLRKLAHPRAGQKHRSTALPLRSHRQQCSLNKRTQRVRMNAKASRGLSVKTQASADGEDSSKEQPKKPSAPAPVEQSGDYFIPILVFVAYAGFSVAMGMAIDWDLIFDMVGLGSGGTEITYDFGK